MKETLVWVVYDISVDKIRNRVVKECKKAGLYRVQKSIFLGKLNWNRFDELGEKCLDLIDQETDSVYLFPFSQENFSKITIHGQGFDKKFVNNEILAMFF